MARTRIRWRSVGRLAGGVALGTLGLYVAADVLEPPPPEPLPPDIGLASGASGFQAYEPQPRSRPDPAPRPPPREQPDARPAGEPRRADPPPQHHPEPRQDDLEAPPTTPSPPAPDPPHALPPQPPPPPTPPTEPQAQYPARGDVEAEFGFEPRR